MTYFAVVLISFLVAVIVTVIALIIYDNTMTPSKLNDKMNKVNRYLNELITGFKEASPPS